ncbi:MAG TPA: hypothetical protein VK589_14295 [Chryseolinea sp.]|nr:hypothetical protein [Chryseolinea sp.]
MGFANWITTDDFSGEGPVGTLDSDAKNKSRSYIGQSFAAGWSKPN